MVLLKNLAVMVEDQQIIHDVSLSIDSGSVHAIMGQNGSGKSSLAHTIMGLPSYHVTTGTMVMNDHNVLDLSLHERSKLGIFLAFQQPVAIPGVTVFQFLQQIFTAAGKQSLPADFQQYLKDIFQQVGLDLSFLYRGLHENFSGGEKKRLEIVQMLVLQPKLIILDEIDSGLDIDALRAIALCVRQYLATNSQASCIVITHYPRILDLLTPDYIHVMHAGRLVASGTMQLAYDIEKKGYDVYGQ